MNMKRIALYALCAFLCVGSAAAQNAAWADILFPVRESGWLLFDAGLATRPSSTFFGGGLGFNVDAGFNIARPFSQKVLFAPYCSIEPSWGNSWQGSFVRDLNTGFETAFDPMYSPKNEQERIDFWSLNDGYYNVVKPMLSGETEGFAFSFRYGTCIGLPWRYVPVFRVYGAITMIGVTSSNGPSYTDGTRGPGSLYGPAIPGWGVDVEVFRGKLITSDTAGSIYTCCVRLGLDVCNIADAQIVEADEIDGVRRVTLEEFVNASFERAYANAWSVNLSLQLLSAR